MTEHEHCDHLQSSYEDTAGMHKTYICCHCGRLRSHTVPPIEMKTWEYRESDHGPFVRTIVRF